MDAMELLLSFGATASAARQVAIRERVKLHDVALIRLLLSASNMMSVEAWRSCLEPEIQSLEARWKRSPDLLHFKLLQILCAKCPPSQASIESRFFLAIDSRYYTSEALELLLSSSRYASTALNILWFSEKIERQP